ncbi:diaminopropionate ammonia-lyase [bacterium]|nr:diaminopropionate ammonia-lyase [bacterium]
MNRYIINRTSRLDQWAPRPSRDPMEFHRWLPGYERTPLHNLTRVAGELGLRSLYLKDESRRLTLPAFKILGASWAVYQFLLRETRTSPEECQSLDDLRALAEKLGRRKLITASDGNHGRAVARMASWIGWDAKVFMPLGTVRARIDAIESERATVQVVDGSYDEAVRLARDAEDEYSLLVQDTSWQGYETIPAWIVEGYSTLLWEVDEALQEDSLPQPDLVIVPVGVGALAGAVIRHYRREGIVSPPRILAVEPLGAECALESLTFDEIVTVPGQSDTIMAGLNCGTLASVVWPYIRDGLDGVVAMEDQWAREAVRTLASNQVIAGESGGAALGALIALLKSPDLFPIRKALNLNASSRVLAFATEGITDPVMYARILGAGRSD